MYKYTGGKRYRKLGEWRDTKSERDRKRVEEEVWKWKNEVLWGLDMITFVIQRSRGVFVLSKLCDKYLPLVLPLQLALKRLPKRT
eukprot:501823-Amorphochlora_amoeboformis.AAC.2